MQTNGPPAETSIETAQAITNEQKNSIISFVLSFSYTIFA